MKKLIIALSLLVPLAAGTALAQTPAPRAGIGVAAVGQMPVGDFKDVADLGFGGLAGIEVGTYPGLALTARAGYIQHLQNDDEFSVRLIPILGGVKLNVPATPLYAAGELGAAITRVRYEGADFPFIDEEESETNMAWTAGVGANLGALDLRLMFGVWDAANMSETMTIGVSLGITAFSF